MNSFERHEARYQRRVLKRKQKKEEKYSECDRYDSVFTFSHLYNAYKLSRRNVSWKSSVQKYKANAMINLFNTYNTLQQRSFKSRGFYEFDLYERGKLRHIRSVAIDERVVQRCLCDYCLTPLLTRSFIYDNAASQKNKGITFSINRMSTHLHRYYRKYGSEGYILQYDFSKYFDSLPHKKVKEVIDKHVKDPDLRNITYSLVDDFGDTGLGLGSQVSQILSLACADDIDHAMKEKMRAKYYGRYMDDGYIISHDKAFLERCYALLKEMCDASGIKLNVRKTHITKLSRGFTFLKVKYNLTPTGKVIKRISPKSVVRMRRKLKKLKRRVDNGLMSFEDVVCSVQSWVGHTIHLKSHTSRSHMLKLFYTLFRDKITGGNICIKY